MRTLCVHYLKPGLKSLIMCPPTPSISPDPSQATAPQLPTAAGDDEIAARVAEAKADLLRVVGSVSAAVL